MMENELLRLVDCCLPRDARSLLRAIRLLDRPNVVNVWPYVLWRLGNDLDLYGTAYLWMTPGVFQGHPFEAWAVNPTKVHPNGPTSKFSDGYYAIEGKSSNHVIAVIGVSDMIRFTQPRTLEDEQNSSASR